MGSPLFVGVWCGNFTIRQRWGESIFLTSKKIEISKVTNYEKCSNMNIPESWLICIEKLEWKKWLAANYLKESGVWLQIKKTKSKEPGILLKEAIDEAICYGWIDGKMFSIDNEKYIVRMTPRRKGSM